MKKIITGIFSGDLYLNASLIKEYKFVIFIFLLIILYISKNFGMEKTMLTERNNTRILKNIKANYTGKASRLLDISKRSEIEKMLKERKSSLTKSETAPRVVILEKR